MIQQLLDGLVAALREGFPEIERVYTEEVKQGLREPCFILRLLTPTNKLFLGNRYYRTNLFSVQYLPPDSSDVNALCHDVCDRLFRALEYIKVGEDLWRGTNMNAEYFDGSLVFFINFDGFLTFCPEPHLMEELSIENKAK